MYTIYCLLEGEKNLFPVKIDEDMSAGFLMKEIKKEKSVALKTVDANNLKLYHVGIELDESDEQLHITRANEVFQDLGKSTPLREWRTLSEVEKGFPKGFLHILVQLPPSESIHSRACGAVADGVDARI